MLTRKHSQMIYVMEFAISCTVEGGPEVGDEDLSAFEETHSAAVEPRFIVEAREVLCKEVDKLAGGFVGFSDQTYDGIVW
jgi:hypothetical protein